VEAATPLKNPTAKPPLAARTRRVRTTAEAIAGFSTRVKEGQGLQMLMDPSLNVHGQPLEPCSTDPLTGWYRDGCCNTDEHDRGLHTVCCIVNEAFLHFAKAPEA